MSNRCHGNILFTLDAIAQKQLYSGQNIEKVAIFEGVALPQKYSNQRINGYVWEPIYSLGENFVKFGLDFLN